MMAQGSFLFDRCSVCLDFPTFGSGLVTTESPELGLRSGNVREPGEQGTHNLRAAILADFAPTPATFSATVPGTAFLERVDLLINPAPARPLSDGTDWACSPSREGAAHASAIRRGAW